MSIRNSEELGKNLFLITDRLLHNQDLCKLLKYTDNCPLAHSDIENVNTEILHKNVKIVPIVKAEDFNSESIISIVYNQGNINTNNTEYDKIGLNIMIYTPFNEWIINDINLRPFSIMSEIEKTLKNKTIDGIGKLRYWGFSLDMVTDELSCYKMSFSIETFN